VPTVFVKEATIRQTLNSNGMRVSAVIPQYIDDIVCTILDSAMTKCRKRGGSMVSVADLPLLEGMKKSSEGRTIHRPKVMDRRISLGPRQPQA